MADANNGVNAVSQALDQLVANTTIDEVLVTLVKREDTMGFKTSLSIFVNALDRYGAALVKEYISSDTLLADGFGHVALIASVSKDVSKRAEFVEYVKVYAENLPSTEIRILIDGVYTTTIDATTIETASYEMKQVLHDWNARKHEQELRGNIVDVLVQLKVPKYVSQLADFYEQRKKLDEEIRQNPGIRLRVAFVTYGFGGGWGAANFEVSPDQLVVLQRHPLVKRVYTDKVPQKTINHYKDQGLRFAFGVWNDFMQRERYCSVLSEAEGKKLNLELQEQREEVAQGLRHDQV